MTSCADNRTHMQTPTSASLLARLLHNRAVLSVRQIKPNRGCRTTDETACLLRRLTFRSADLLQRMGIWQRSCESNDTGLHLIMRDDILYDFLSPNSTCCYHTRVNVARARPRHRGKEAGAAVAHFVAACLQPNALPRLASRRQDDVWQPVVRHLSCARVLSPAVFWLVLQLSATWRQTPLCPPY